MQVNDIYSLIYDFPKNIEIGVMLLGRNNDFLGCCAHLKNANEFIVKNNIAQIMPHHYTEYNNYSELHHNDTKHILNKDIAEFNFPDIGDINPVIMPVIMLDRNEDMDNIIKRIVRYEDMITYNSNPEIKKTIDRLTQLEINKELSLTDIDPTYQVPSDNYCKLRVLVLFYYNSVMSSLNVAKESILYQFNLLSFYNFHYPFGSLSGVEKEDQFSGILNAYDHMSDEQSKKSLLERLNLTRDELFEKAYQEKIIRYPGKKQEYNDFKKLHE